MLSTKHENIQALDHKSKQECDRDSIQAYEHLSTLVHIHLISQSLWNSSTIVKAFKRTYVQQHDHLLLQAYGHFMITKCTRVWISNMWISMHVSMQSSKHLNIWASNHQSIQAYENDDIEISVHVMIKAGTHGSIRSSKHVNIKEY